MTSFFTSFFARRKTPAPSDLPLQTRVATLEGEMLQLQQLQDRTHQTVKSLSGKVYRGIALGTTTKAPEDAPTAPEEVAENDVTPTIPFSSGKAELYQRAARLRRH